MKIIVSKDAKELGKNAADFVAEKINAAIADHGSCRIVLSTGASQLTTIEELITRDVDWTKVEMFHLDEYVDLPETHVASFRKYLKERFISKVPLKAAHLVDGTPECIGSLTEELRSAPVDVGLIGIGENAHIAFNDPPADFDTNEAYRLVALDEKCRMQQVGEGWFATEDDVPKQAFSMSIKQIMWSKAIVCTCPDARKAEAVKNCLEGKVSNMVPGTILQMHPDCGMFLDPGSAALLGR